MSATTENLVAELREKLAVQAVSTEVERHVLTLYVRVNERPSSEAMVELADIIENDRVLEEWVSLFSVEEYFSIEYDYDRERFEITVVMENDVTMQEKTFIRSQVFRIINSL